VTTLTVVLVPRGRGSSPEAGARQVKLAATLSVTLVDAVAAALAEQVARALDVPVVRVVRHEPDGTETECATTGAHGAETGLGSSVAVPIVVAGRDWGAMVASTTEAAPPGTEARLVESAALLATAIENAESRTSLERVGAEQAALRRVATLLARGAEPTEVFSAVSREVDRLFPSGRSAVSRFDGDALVIVGFGQAVEGIAVGSRWELDDVMATTAVHRTGRPARVDGIDWSAVDTPLAAPARSIATVSTVACPVVVEGQLWGAIAVSSSEPLPPDTEERLEKFTELAATAVANGAARREVLRLAEEQAALRGVATLVARGAPREEVFMAIAEGIGTLLGSEEIRMMRYEGDELVVVEAAWGADPAVIPVGARHPLGGDNVSSLVFRTGRPARIDDYAAASGAVGATARSVGLRCVVGTPIVVNGRLWGLMAAGTMQPRPLPPDTDVRLGQFTELMATAIANTESRERADRLAREQDALRRVATLVATEPSLEEVFGQVASEVSRLLGDVEGSLFRDEGDGTATLVAVGGPGLAGAPVGRRLPTDGDGVIATVLREGRAHRIDDYAQITGAIAEEGRDRLGIRAAAGCPIVVGGRLWGALGAGKHGPGPLPPDTEPVLARFAELAATAIGNAEARAEVERLAEEQAALRRVAELVAEGASPAAVFEALAAEIATRLGSYGVSMCRYEPGDELTIVAHHGAEAWQLPPGTRIHHDDPHSTTNIVRRTARPARVDSYADTHGSIGRVIEGLTYRSGVGVPLVVEGRLWGVAVANWAGDERPPPDTEQRMARFAQLLATAIANADGREQLVASRARLLTAGDEARRRVVRDLHDGAQQRLVHTIVTLKMARRALRNGTDDADTLLDEALEHAERSNAELRELAHGLHPAALTLGGLRGGVGSVVERLDLPVDVDVIAERLPPEIEASAYFIVAEALTNVVKHSQAARAEVTASLRDGMLDVQVRDDGIGGADPDGHGLVGMKDRVAALGGRFEIRSPAGGGTHVVASLPLTHVG
jgi:signal transduction histidine kinase